MATTGYYLLDNTPAVTQYLRTRRNGRKVSGVMDAHTWESAPDWVGPDTGLERAVGYELTRLDPGSYHSAVDSDSTIRLVPWWMEAFHDRFTNNHAIGISIATQAHKWADAPREWRDNAVKRAAVEAARIADEVFLDDGTHTTRPGIDIPARWLTQAEAHNGVPGFVRHGTSDPGRRSDPWPADAPEGDLFLTYYKAARTTGQYAGQTLPEEEDDMFTDEDRKRLQAIQDKTDRTFHGVDKSLLPATTAVREHVYALRTQTVPQLQGEIRGLTVALGQVASGGLDLDAVMQAAREGASDGVSEALAAVEADITLTVTNAPKEA